RVMSKKHQACGGFMQRATHQAIDKLEACRAFSEEPSCHAATPLNNENEPRRRRIYSSRYCHVTNKFGAYVVIFHCFSASYRDIMSANAQSSFFQIVISAGLAKTSAQFCLKV